MRMKVKLQIILASASPWRKRLLKKRGVVVKVRPSSFKELTNHKNPRHLVLYNARGKAREVAVHYKSSPYAIIIGVDTIGVHGTKILGKPKNRAHAGRMLRTLFCTMHRVISGVHIINTKTGAEKYFTDTTKVTFREVTAAELSRYLASNHWKGKAGSYAIQGRAKGFVEKIDGDITNVIGIPVEKVKSVLKIIS